MFKSLKLINEARDFLNYRWFYTSEGKLVIGGKSEEQNESVLRNFLRPYFVVMHTSKPGSPFMIIQSSEPSKKDLEETAIFCACFSKQWKSGSKEVDIDVFNGSQMYKDKTMKTGTFGVKGRKKKVKTKLDLILIIQNGKLRAVPKIKRNEETLASIKPGKMSKEDATDKIAKRIKDKFHFPISKDEIMQAIPSDGISVR